ncbi:MAG: hypothetical protein K0S80_705 [Neobacillus sp.]|nr:hypothetical protein [Neobacillus sp.]
MRLKAKNKSAQKGGEARSRASPLLRNRGNMTFIIFGT